MDDKQLLTSAQVRTRYGGVSHMTLYRWVTDQKLAFPKPESIRSRNYWRLSDLDAWDKARKQPAGEAA